MRSGNEKAKSVVEKVSRSSMDDISSQLEKRQSKEAMIADLKAARKMGPKPASQTSKRQPVQSFPLKNNRNEKPKQQATSNADDEKMKALLKSSLPKNLPKPTPVPVVNATLTPAMQRKLLFEKLAADEKIKEETRKSQKKRTINNGTTIGENMTPMPVTAPPNTHKLVKDSLALLSKPIKKELSTNQLDEVQKNPTNPSSTKKSYMMNIKKENEPTSDIVPDDHKQTPSMPLSQTKQGPVMSVTKLTSEQEKILATQFEIKDYLSRKEMRALALKANLTDAQVRDWFKAKRVKEDTPMIVEEKSSGVSITSTPIVVKQEPLEEAEDQVPVVRPAVVNSVANIVVKQEPEDEPDSAVLDPLTGNLLKKSNVDRKLEDILAKAPLLDSLTKKIEMVSKPPNSKDNMKNKLNDIIDILDDEIEITKENIVNPGPKEKPLTKVLNTFLSQVEQLEKSMDVNEFSKNIELDVILKETKRKDEIIKDLTSEISDKKNEIINLGKELNDKNDDIESILLNSVSKETFIRSQFQNLTTEVRKLKQEKADSVILQDRIKELEGKLRKKTHEVEDLKAKYDSSQTNLKKRDKDIKDLEEMSTKMIGDITKGIGEKLAVAKTKEQELKASLEKNATMESDLDELGKRFKKLNDDLTQIKAEEKATNEALSEKCTELAKSVKRKDEEVFMIRSENDNLVIKMEGQLETIKTANEENEKLKDQVNNLTNRFRSKVKEIQETLSNYNDTLKSKNKEIVDQAQEIFKLKEENGGQLKLISTLEDTVENNAKEITNLKMTGETMKKILEERRTETQKRKRKTVPDEEIISCKRINIRTQVDRIPILASCLPPSKRLTNIFLSPISLQVSAPLLSLGYNWPIVPYTPPTSLLGLLSPVERVTRCMSKGQGSKRKIKCRNTGSEKKFRISVANRPVRNVICS